MPGLKDVESDIDIADEKEEYDPIQDFLNSSEDIFRDSVQNQKVQKRPVKEFINTLKKEIRSVKLSCNAENEDAIQILTELIILQVIEEEIDGPLTEVTDKCVREKIEKAIDYYNPLLADYCV